MGSEILSLHNKGIFHNLRALSSDIKRLKTIVTVANGISGFHTVRVLLEGPQSWSKVWAALRRPPPEAMMALLSSDQRAPVEHMACDFLIKPEDIVRELKKRRVTADAIYFYCYAQPPPQPGNVVWSNAQELSDTIAG